MVVKIRLDWKGLQRITINVIRNIGILCRKRFITSAPGDDVIKTIFFVTYQWAMSLT